MNTKIMTSVGCLLLLAAAIAPSVLGHSERDPLANSLSGYAGTASTGVSGRYVGSAGPSVADFSVDPTNPDVFAAGGMLCDAEVIVDSNTAGQGGETNEDFVDGVNTVSANADFWDDGGQGGACHTNHYTGEPLFNTPGCQEDDLVYAKTHAGTDVWVGAGCDWKTDQGGTSSEQTLLLCLTTALFAFNPLEVLGPPTPDVAGLLAEIQPFIDCLTAFADCLGDQTTDCQIGGTEECGPDATSDAVNYGYGSSGGVFGALQATFPANTGIYFGTPEAESCDDGTANVFVFDAVNTDLASVPEVLPALSGEIWS